MKVHLHGYLMLPHSWITRGLSINSPGRSKCPVVNQKLSPADDTGLSTVSPAHWKSKAASTENAEENHSGFARTLWTSTRLNIQQGWEQRKLEDKVCFLLWTEDRWKPSVWQQLQDLAAELSLIFITLCNDIKEPSSSSDKENVLVIYTTHFNATQSNKGRRWKPGFSSTFCSKRG